MENFVKNLTLFLFAIYGVGFIVINFYLNNIGIDDMNALSINYLKAGFNFALFIGPSFLMTWMLHRFYDGRVIKTKWIITIISIVVSNSILLLLYFGMIKGHYEIIFPFAALGFLYIWFINRFLYTLKKVGIGIFLLALLFSIYITTYFSFKNGVNEFSAIWIILNCSLFTLILNIIWAKFLDGFKDEVEYGLYLLSVSVVIIFTSAVYGITMYSRIPFVLGGGEATSKRLVPNSGFNHSIISDYKLDSTFWSNKKSVLYENDNKIYFSINDTLSIGVNKNTVDEIIPQKHY